MATAKSSKSSHSSKSSKTAKSIRKAEKAVVEPAKKIVTVGESQLKGFIDFIRTQGVVGLAVGLVLGTAVSALVKSLVDNVVMPPLGLLLGSAQGIAGLSWTLGKARDGSAAILQYGLFLNNLINFIVIALVIYLVLKLLRVDQLDKKKE